MRCILFGVRSRASVRRYDRRRQNVLLFQRFLVPCVSCVCVLADNSTSRLTRRNVHWHVKLAVLPLGLLILRFFG